jgi:hypothetical protein
MVPLGDQVVVAPDARMDGVLGKLQDGEAGRVLVVQDGEDHHAIGSDPVAAPVARPRRPRALSRSKETGSGCGSTAHQPVGERI